PPHDADAVARLVAAGAIPLAKANTPEFSLWWETDNRVFGRTLNPLGSVAYRGRLLRRRRGGGRGRAGRLRARQRPRRLHPRPRGALRGRGLEADARPRPARRPLARGTARVPARRPAHAQRAGRRARLLRAR